MTQYINKAAIEAEIEDIESSMLCEYKSDKSRYAEGSLDVVHRIKRFLNTLKVKEVDLEKENETFNSLRNQASIAAMQGVMNFFGSIDYNKETIAKLAVEQANALVEELKKNNYGNN